MAKLLASVADLKEAALALALGADILDLKRPTEGVLGAWPTSLVGAAVARFGGKRPLSATIGDHPPLPDLVGPQASAMAATSVDYVKIGFFSGGNPVACARTLASLAGKAGLVAVLMADQAPDFSLVPTLAEGGFAGVMLDTADKRRGPLRAHLDDAALASFVNLAHAHGLLCGLAGSLSLADITPLAALGPDYLGFRGALCRGSRETALDPAAFQAVRAALASSATATAGAQVATSAAA